MQQQNSQVFAVIDSCFAGMAGVKELQAEEVVESIVRQYVPKTARVIVDNDALIALYAGTLGQAGIVQIAGQALLQWATIVSNAFIELAAGVIF